MTHTVCGSPVVMRPMKVDDQLTLMVPYCPTCDHIVADEELTGDE